MKRFFLFVGFALGLLAPAEAQLMSAPLTPMPPAVTLGPGLPSALANPANTNGGVLLLNGSAAAGNCLTWSANGLQDVGAPCLVAPIGAAKLSGTGASAATSLADRATDAGVAFNLKIDFGAKCDGATDDAAAILAWLAKAAPGVKLVAPAGTCLFSSPLTLGALSNYTVEGAGSTAATLAYAGADTGAAAAAGASWTTAATTLTLAAAAPAFLTATFPPSAYKVAVWDKTPALNGTAKSPVFVGFVQSVSGSTVTLAAAAANASVGSSDALLFSVDLLAVNPAMTGGVHGIVLRNLRITSKTPLTGGYAIRDAYVRSTLLDNVTLGGIDIGDPGYICGGFWSDGASGVQIRKPDFMLSRQRGDAILANAVPSQTAGTAELQVSGGAIGGDYQGGFLTGAHLAGGFGGLRFDGTDIANVGTGVVIDNAVIAQQNREFDLGSTAAIDSTSGDGVYVNDLYAGGRTIDIDGWVASQIAGHGLHVKKWANGYVMARSHDLWNTCGSAIYTEDSTTTISVSPNARITNAGNSVLGGTAQFTGSISGNTLTVSAVSGGALALGHTLGGAGIAGSPTILAGSGLSWTISGAPQAVASEAMYSAGNATWLACAAWQAANPGHGYGIEAASATSNIVSYANPTANSAGPYNQNTGLASLGFVGYGGTVGNAFTVTSQYYGAYIQINSQPGYPSQLSFDNGTAQKWTLGNDAGANTLTGWDNANSSMWWLRVATGGNMTLGEQNSNVATFYGVIQAKSGATPTASGSCAVTAQAGGEMAGSFKASGACSGGAVTLTFPTSANAGYACDAHDVTTPGDQMNETGYSPTSVTFTGSMANNDTVVFKCMAF